MTVHYKLWLKIEQIDLSRDHRSDVAELLGTFAAYEEICAFVERAHPLIGANVTRALQFFRPDERRQQDD